MKYIPAEKLIAEIKRRRNSALERQKNLEEIGQKTVLNEMIAFILNKILSFITSLQQEQSINMIQWTGDNLQEVIDFTGKSPRFGEWFKSWDEFESYVHSHGDILKLFSEDGSHYEVPVGAWIVKTPDGYNVPSVARFIQAKQEQPVLPGIEYPGIPGKDFIPVEWVDACEMYGKWKIVKQEQPEVDFEKAYESYMKSRKDDVSGHAVTVNMKDMARYFWYKGFNVRKAK